MTIYTRIIFGTLCPQKTSTILIELYITILVEGIIILSRRSEMELILLPEYQAFCSLFRQILPMKQYLQHLSHLIDGKPHLKPQKF